jgi:hypothetical protein
MKRETANWRDVLPIHFPLRHWPLRSQGGDEHEDKTAVTLKATVTTPPRRLAEMQTPTRALDSGG